MSATPEPLPNPVEPELLIRRAFILQARDTLDALVAMLENGHNPVRTLFLIESYAATMKTHIAEVDSDEDPPLDDDSGIGFGGAQYVVAGAGGGQRPVGARRRRGGLNAAYPAHGGPYGGGNPLNEAMNMMGGLSSAVDKMTSSRGDSDVTRQIRDLSEAIASARTLGDEDLEARLRDRLDKLLDPVPDNPTTIDDAVEVVEEDPDE